MLMPPLTLNRFSVSANAHCEWTLMHNFTQYKFPSGIHFFYFVCQIWPKDSEECTQVIFHCIKHLKHQCNMRTNIFTLKHITLCYSV